MQMDSWQRMEKANRLSCNLSILESNPQIMRIVALMRGTSEEVQATDKPTPIASQPYVSNIFLLPIVDIWTAEVFSQGVMSRREAQLVQSFESIPWAQEALYLLAYDQYEIAVPLENAGTCLESFVRLIEERKINLFTPPLIRFLAANDA